MGPGPVLPALRRVKKMFKRLMFASLAVVMMLMAAPVSAEMNPEGSGEMTLDNLDLITGYLVSDQYLASRLKLRKLDKDPVPELITIAQDTKKKVFVRERAIKSMSLFRDQRVKVAFEKMLKGAPDRYFSITVMSFMEAFGEDGVKDIKEFLAHSDAEVRLTTVRALGLFGGAAGYDLLQQHSKSEGNPQVLSQLQAYL